MWGYIKLYFIKRNMYVKPPLNPIFESISIENTHTQTQNKTQTEIVKY